VVTIDQTIRFVCYDNGVLFATYHKSELMTRMVVNSSSGSWRVTVYYGKDLFSR